MLTNSEPLFIASENPLSPDSLSLLRQLTVELVARYGDDGGANSFQPHHAMVAGAVFMVARLGPCAVGCGAIRPLEPSVAEVKRMFVVPEYRGRGIARRILNELEHRALKLGYNRTRLETGLSQPEAIALYESAGYHRVLCYGQYAPNPMSICFEKMLVEPEESHLASS